MLPAGISEQADADRRRAAREPEYFGRRYVRQADFSFSQCDGAETRPKWISIRRSRLEFSEAVEIASATWNWESGQLLGTSAAAGDWRGIFARLSRLETAQQRLRDWARLFRRPSGLRQLGPRAMIAAARVGSLATLIYGSGCVIDFFWDEIGSDKGRGTEMAAELCRALAIRSASASERQAAAHSRDTHSLGEASEVLRRMSRAVMIAN